MILSSGAVKMGLKLGRDPGATTEHANLHMKANQNLAILGAIVVLCAIAGKVAFEHRPPGARSQPAKPSVAVDFAPARQTRPTVAEVATTPTTGLPPTGESSSAAKSVPTLSPVPVPVPPQLRASVAPPPAGQIGGRAAPPDQDEMARVALSFVGLDRAAEMYWVEAINDPNLSDHERQNLIEDLNEDGISDPKHPTLADLPVIVSRLQLIEELAPYAVDQVNFDAFAEAYKDLVNLADVATGRGQPVR